MLTHCEINKEKKKILLVHLHTDDNTLSLVETLVNSGESLPGIL